MSNVHVNPGQIHLVTMTTEDLNILADRVKEERKGRKVKVGSTPKAPKVVFPYSAEEIKGKREEHGLSRKQVALELGLTAGAATSVWMWETDDRPVPVKHHENLKRILDEGVTNQACVTPERVIEDEVEVEIEDIETEEVEMETDGEPTDDESTDEMDTDVDLTADCDSNVVEDEVEVEVPEHSDQNINAIIKAAEGNILKINKDLVFHLRLQTTRGTMPSIRTANKWASEARKHIAENA